MNNFIGPYIKDESSETSPVSIKTEETPIEEIKKEEIIDFDKYPAMVTRAKIIRYKLTSD